MMGDPLNCYLDFLKEKGYMVDALSDSSFSIELSIQGQTLVVECELPDFFPYEFPIIRLPNVSLQTCIGIPHLLRDDTLCLFNEADARPNFLRPFELVLATIHKAEEVIVGGLEGNQQNAFEDEILNYWQKNDEYCIHLFSDLGEEATSICLSKSKDSGKGVFIATKTSADNITIYKKATLKDRPNVIEYGLYIPLTSGFTSYEVRTEKKMWSALDDRVSKKDKKTICQVASRTSSKRHLFYIVSFLDANKERVFVGWRGRTLSKVDGFRRGHISPFLYWKLQKEDDIAIQRASVTLCTQARLFTRGSYGYGFRFRSATVIGCGSVGSYLCSMLASMGADSFLLVDNESLSVDNIARHLCGYDMVGLPKTFAVKWRLEKNNPNICCTEYTENAYSAIKAHLNEINQYEALFVAVGDLPLEAYIINLGKQNLITIPTIITWVEPKGYAAHMVYISQYDNAFENLICLDTMCYKRSVLKTTSALIEHDAGCQSGYVPYSGLNVQNYLSECLHKLSRIRTEESLQGNYHFTWVGELSEARRNNIPINPEFSDAQDFSMCIKRFE